MGGLQYKEVSATPVSEMQVTSTLVWLAAIATDGRKPPLVAAVAARDGAMLSIMWGTMMRGNEVGGMQLAGLRLADGSSALPKLLPYLTLAPGEEWLIKPVRTKTEKANVVRPRRVKFGVVAHDLDPAVWVHRALLTAALARQPVTGQLVRPMTRDRQGFKEAPLKSTALNYVFKTAGRGRCVGRTNTTWHPPGEPHRQLEQPGAAHRR